MFEQMGPKTEMLQIPPCPTRLMCPVVGEASVL